jgi:hypothetical protein
MEHEFEFYDDKDDNGHVVESVAEALHKFKRARPNLRQIGDLERTGRLTTQGSEILVGKFSEVISN